MSSRRSILLPALAWLVPFCVSAQSIVSVHSGVVHFFEGAVSIDGQALEQKFGRFHEIKPGSELRTEQGRAEVLLTPGVLLRVDENSSIRMVSNRLADTRIEFIGGAAALDSRNAAPGAPVLINYKDYQMQFSRSGRYRFESTPGQLRVDEGEAEVRLHGKSVMVKAAQVLPFSPALTAHADNVGTDDGLDRWNKDRSASIAADNATAADSDNLSSTLGDPQAGAYNAGGGYSGVLLPDPISPAYYGTVGMSPFSLYSMPLYRFGYIPLYLRAPVYRSFPGRTTGTTTFRIPARSYTPTRTTTTLPPGRAVAPPRPAFHPAIHR